MPRSEAARELLRKTGTALHSRWMLLLLLIPVVLLAMAAAMLIWPINYAEGPYRPDPYRQYATPSSLTSLLNDDSLAGESVYLNDVSLMPGAKENEYIAQGSAGHAILVITNGPASALPKEPTIADVQGVIRPLPSDRVLKRVWKLNGKLLAAVSAGEYYVSAQSIRVDAHNRARH
jgi:hypothetical protein